MPSGLDIIAWPFGFLVDGALTLGVGAAVTICLCVTVVRCILFPLSQHQARSQWVLAGLRPQVAQLHERYMTDAHGVREELVALYRAHRVSPFGAIAVIVPQAIALFGLYWAVRPHFLDMAGIDALGDLNAHALDGPAGICLIVAYVVGFCTAMWISAKRTTLDVSRFTYAFMAAVPAGALLAMPIMTVGMALYLAATAVTTLAQSIVLWRLYPRRNNEEAADGADGESRGVAHPEAG